jgi:hypothetical protein
MPKLNDNLNTMLSILFIIQLNQNYKIKTIEKDQRYWICALGQTKEGVVCKDLKGQAVPMALFFKLKDRQHVIYFLIIKYR